jgi:glycerol-1-phosphate dehydrogenase [NAD(P)+]
LKVTNVATSPIANPERLESALRAATSTRSVTIGRGAVSAVAEVFRQHFAERSAIIVADENTYAVAGGEVQRHLHAAGCRVKEPCVFPGKPALYADYQRVLEVEAVLRAQDVIPLAVGSGTLNDLTKLASYRCERPYAVVATAASMDGYGAFGAAITRDGFKQTMACPAPRAVVADTDILAGAPPAMTASGYADLLGKVTAGADWLVADALEREPIHGQAWSLVQDSLREWTAEPERLRLRDPAAVGRLTEGLIFAGLAMQAAQSSRAASGSEHQFSHLWEMQGLAHAGTGISHGFKVGIGLIASAALYERLLRRDLSRLDIAALCRAWPTRDDLERLVRRSHAIPLMAENAAAQSLAKHGSADELRRRLELLRMRWAPLQKRLEQQLLSPARLRDMLQAAGCPTSPGEIGLEEGRFQASYALARQIRSRYTVFDLAAESGCFEACVAELFAPGGYWATAGAV